MTSLKKSLFALATLLMITLVVSPISSAAAAIQCSNGGTENQRNSPRPEKQAARLGQGINVSFLEQPEHSRELTNSDYAFIRARGFDHIRLPVDFFANMTSGNVHSTYFAEVDNAINLALANNLKVVLDLHASGPYQFTSWSAAQGNKLASTWTQIAERYKTKSIHNLYFEIYNEPYGQATTKPARYNSAVSKAVAAIRATCGSNVNRPIIVDVADRANYTAVANLSLPADKHLIVSLHYYGDYPPADQASGSHAFTHSGVDFDGDGTLDFDAHLSWPTATATAPEVRQHLAAAKSVADSRGWALYVGEFGVNGGHSGMPGAHRASRRAWLRQVSGDLLELHLPSAAWEYHRDFGFVRYADTNLANPNKTVDWAIYRDLKINTALDGEAALNS